MNKVDSRTKNSIRNIFFGGLDRVTAIVFPFIVRTIFIHTLGEEYLGLGSLYASILQVINLADLGFSSAIAAALYKPIAENDYDRVGGLLNLYDRIYKILAIVILAVGLGVSPFLSSFIEGDVPNDINIYTLWLIYLAHTVSSYLFFAYRVSLLSAIQRSDISSIVATAVRTIISTIQIILVVKLHSMYLYAILNVVYTVLYNCICAYICKTKYPYYQKRGNVPHEIRNKIKKDVISLALQKIGNTVSLSLDSIIISSFLGLSIVAIYGNYYYVISAVVIFISLVVTSITASIGNSIVTESKEKNYEDFKKIFFIHSWLIGWCCTCFLVLFQDFMIIWMGKNLLLPISVVIALIGRFYFEQIRRVVLNYKDAAGIWTYDRFRPVVGCLVNLVLNIITVRFWGVIGVAISTIVDFAVIELPWETRVLFKYFFKTDQKAYYLKILKSIVFTAINMAVTYFICSLVKVDGWGALTLKGIICLVVPNCLFFLELKNDESYFRAKSLITKAIQTIGKR